MSRVAQVHTLPSDTRATLDRLAITFVVTYLSMVFVVTPTYVIDPFIHFDDYPTLYLFKDGYYEKTLTEGRWVNYLWFFRGILTPAWLNFQLFLALWSLFVAASSTLIFRRGDLRIALILAVFLAHSPQTTLIAGWFNTLIPGLLIMASFTVLALFVTPRTSTRLLWLYVPLSVQAYTPYPFLLFALCLLRDDRDLTLSDLVWITLTFIGSFILGLLIIYSLNYAVHGVFGVELGECGPGPRAVVGGQPVDLGHDVGDGPSRVLANVHRGRTGVGREPQQLDVVPPQALHPGDHADVDAVGLEDRALFDVQFDARRQLPGFGR